MSDLRARIAAVIKQADEVVYEDGHDPFLQFRPASYDDMADAVIAELRQLMVDKADDYVPSYAAVLRNFVYHVTDDWKADDD